MSHVPNVYWSLGQMQDKSYLIKGGRFDLAHGWRASRPSRWRRRGIGVRAGWSQDLVRKQREERISTQFDLFLGLVWIISPPDGPSHFQGGSFSLNCLRNALIGTPRGVPYVIPVQTP